MAPDFVGPVVAREYAFAPGLECELHAVNLNEHYLVRTGSEKYFFRLYSNCAFWAVTESEYRFELEWLDFLRGLELPVSFPIRRVNGNFLGRLKTPEGSRYFALFSFAEGEQSYPPTLEQSHRLGAEVAAIHLASNRFQTKHKRIQYTLDILVDGAVQRIRSFLGENRKEDQEFLVALAEELTAQVMSLPKTGDCYGVIGGGFLGTNNHFAGDGTITLFGFDFCGYGWRVFDLAQFLWHARLYNIPGEAWEHFLAGYQSRRQLTPAELDAIPAFVKIKNIFTVGYHTTFAKWMGDSSFDDYYWDKHFEPLRAW